jgi:hypothetical protein
MHYEARSPRLTWLRKKGYFFSYSTVNVCTHAEDISEDLIDAFYDLSRFHDNSPKHGIKTVLGDMNTQKGRKYINLQAVVKGYIKKLILLDKVLSTFSF